MTHFNRFASKTPRILLAGVFGPYGVDDEFGRAKNIMELFHNQVTKGQGLASFRLHHRSFGLYFIAANLNADVTVLDFPSRARFKKEVKKGYDIVGISFITPNFKKAKEMAQICRNVAPDSEIVLGGHGAAIEGVESLIDCDHVAKGEGIRWFREHLGQDKDSPIVHPTLPASDWQAIYGVPIPGKTNNLLVPGVGCVNGCNFCATSHYFGKTYTPFLRTGKEIFDTCCRIADERGTDNFFVMDENFLKDKERALALIDEMERHQRYFKFYLFSSAETIANMGIDNLVRLGVIFIWIGFETKSRQGNYEKNISNHGQDLVRQLRDVGVSVLASGILCLEEHTQENIQEDIDFMIGLNADLVQFMLYTPLPVTALYTRLKGKGLIRDDLPFEDWHGQQVLNWRHPAFPDDSAERWLNRAFKMEYEANFSSVYRMIKTAFRGYKTLAAASNDNPHTNARMAQMAKRTQEYRPMLEVLKTNASPREQQQASQLQHEITSVLGSLSMSSKLLALGARTAAVFWKMRVKLKGDMRQPRTICTHYRRHKSRLSPAINPVCAHTEAAKDIFTSTDAAAYTRL
ncbi:MAG: radical SAM protein [Deltaproteobacteria bacterium]|nr:radical SAM protein [Deltaproteobacteria bacterium]MBN2673788.1 radical SAM protein [Deltaproteobacteria bacterium]